MKNQGKVKALLNRVDVEMRRNHTNVEYLVEASEALKYFQLSNMRYDDRNVVTERVSATVLQLYLISIPAQILNTLQSSRGRI